MKIPWRGAAVVACWIGWPVAFFNLYWLVNVMLATGRRCSIEGCDPPEGVLGWLWLAAMVAPPLYVTTWWVRWRRRASGAERAPDARGAGG